MIFIAIVSIVVYSAVLLFLITGLLRSRGGENDRLPRVSVVVAARNESKTIAPCLTALSEQAYPKELTEIVVANDRSTDTTADILSRFNQKHGIKILNIKKTPAGVSPKKYALSRAIEQASGELIFCTDADCVPRPDWLATTVRMFRPGVGLVVGLAPLNANGTFLSKLLSLDSFASALVASGSCAWNVAVTCTGRNLAYRKTVWEQVRGFAEINHIVSGDDDLFLHLVRKQTSWTVTSCTETQARVESLAPKTWREFFRQKRRHISAARYYSPVVQAGYGLHNLANLVIVAFFLSGLFYKPYLVPATAVLVLKLSLDWLALWLMAATLEKRSLLFLFPVWEIFFIITQTFVAPFGFFGKIEWKQ